LPIAIGLRALWVSVIGALGDHGPDLVGEARHAGAGEIIEKVPRRLRRPAPLAGEPDDRVGDLAGGLVGKLAKEGWGSSPSERAD
jgi:hypothetical protein